MASLAERLAGLSAAARRRVLERRAAAVVGDWRLVARPEQLPPPGDWRTWLLMAGRGFGKTRSGSGWVQVAAEAMPGVRIALIGATMADARGVMVEGESGLLAKAPARCRPRFEPSRRRLVWSNGSEAMLFSAEEPEALRGPQFGAAWGDELARWPRAEALWANLQMALRLGSRPRTVLTTTPRPVPIVRMLLADPTCAVTRGRTADNAGNLAPGFVAAMEAAYGGTRLGRQELDGELIEDVAGALWTRARIEACRTGGLEPERFRRVVVGVDPPAGAGGTCGIVAAALMADGRAAVLADASVGGVGPEGWAAAVAACAEGWGADRVVAEVNQGGAMVESVLRAAGLRLAVESVRASRGKVARAEPVAGLYAAGRVVHAGAFPALEDEMCGLVAGGDYAGPGRSPDRADALVWALTALLLGAHAPRPGVRTI